MRASEDRLRVLLEKLAVEALSPQEQQELDELLRTALPAAKKKFLKQTSADDMDQQLQVYGHIRQQLKKDATPEVDTPVVSMHRPRRLWLKYAAAAVMVLGLGTSIYWWQQSKSNIPDYTQATQEERFKNEVPAATDGAVLTLADGTQLVLDNINGQLATQGEVAITKDGSELNYTLADVPTNQPVVYNSVTTPRGKYISLVLSDGTKIWLNAASRLRYPVAFTGQDRRVQVTGEAYFDVATVPGKPFIVATPDGLQVEVKGTQFNIEAYDDEPYSITTLVEGQVQVQKGQQQDQLLPGQQLIAGKETMLWQQRKVNVNEYIAWKEGLFHFEDTSLEEIMKQLSRWYDVDVSFQTNADKHYYFTISRQEPLSRLLGIMEKAGNVRFVIDGQHITVIP